MDWEKWLNEYKRVSAMDFEEWLIDRFDRKYGHRRQVYLNIQDLLHIDLWKNGYRNATNILRNKERDIPELTLPKNDYIQKDGCVICENLVTTIDSLDELVGVGVPTASAILTILRPNVFSVIDKFAIKAMQILRDDDPQIQSKKNITTRHYVRYMYAFWQLAETVQEVSEWSFRDIDRALWAYGKHLFVSHKGAVR